MTYEQIKESRRITSIHDLPLSIQIDLNDFIYFYKPEFVKLCGSFCNGSWVDDLDSGFAKIRKSKGKRVRISDCDIIVDSNCRCPNKYKSIDVVKANKGVIIYSNVTKRTNKC